jgi:hypothetical protein
MNTKQQITSLWKQFREAINSAYAEVDKKRDENGICLRDYAENISWSDNLATLLDRETANERQHRSNRPSIPGFSAETAAKLILLNQASNGAGQEQLPQSTAFLVFRQTAVEAQVIGFLAKNYLSPEWHQAVNALNYAKLMQPEQEVSR